MNLRFIGSVGVWAAGLALLAGRGAWAAPGGFRPERWELRAGYAYQYTNRSRPTHFQLLNLLPSVVFPLTEPVGPGLLRGRFEWQPELWLGFFTHPYDRPLIGATPIQFRYAFLPEWRLKPYLFAGAGILYANVNRRETRWDLNFNLQGGAGIGWALNESTSLILEYRHIHISNAGLHEDNSGANTHTFLVGVSVKR